MQAVCFSFKSLRIKEYSPREQGQLIKSYRDACTLVSGIQAVSDPLGDNQWHPIGNLVCLSVCLSVGRSVGLSVCLFVCLFAAPTQQGMCRAYCMSRLTMADEQYLGSPQS